MFKSIRKGGRIAAVTIGIVAARISSLVHRKYMNRCSIYIHLPACFLSKNFATPKTQSRQGFSCPTVGT